MVTVEKSKRPGVQKLSIDAVHFMRNISLKAPTSQAESSKSFDFLCNFVVLKLAIFGKSKLNGILT